MFGDKQPDMAAMTRFSVYPVIVRFRRHPPKTVINITIVPGDSQRSSSIENTIIDAWTVGKGLCQRRGNVSASH